MKTILCALVTLIVGCHQGFEELPERTATVYACGDWMPEHFEQIEGAIADWNSLTMLENGDPPLRYGGHLAEENSFEESDVGDGRHCIYMLLGGSLNGYEQEIWDEQREQNGKGAVFWENDDIVIFKSPLPLPPGARWMFQNLVAHELGHSLGLDHAPDGTDSIMTSKPNSWLITAYDQRTACEVLDCP